MERLAGTILLREFGIAVLVPNVRGSSGYGKDYLLLDNGMKREDSVRDIGALLDWIDRRPELDGERVGVSGGSYGGYMVLASMARYPARIRAGIDVVGISHFGTFLKNTENYRRGQHAVLAAPLARRGLRPAGGAAAPGYRDRRPAAPAAPRRGTARPTSRRGSRPGHHGWTPAGDQGPHCARVAGNGHG